VRKRVNTIIFVIIYNKKVEDSKTILSLLKMECENYDLKIINNGPELVDVNYVENELCNKKTNVTLEQYLENKPLSILYNKLLKESYSYDRFIFFDDDTLIPECFFGDINSSFYNGLDLQLPKIISDLDKTIYYPLVNDVVISSNAEKIKLKHDDSIFSIGSGLIIYKSLLEKFNVNNKKLFDERFAFYGVDVSLFKRINLLKKTGTSFNIQLCSEIYHDLSRVNSKNNFFRERERMYDSILSKIHYSNGLVDSVFFITKKGLKYILTLRFHLFFLLIRTLLIRKHPRC